MKLRADLIAKAYAAVDVATAATTPFVPRRLHPGWRLCHSLQHIRDAPSGPYFARAVLASQWRCALLMRYALQLTRPQLRTFLEERVSYEGAAYAHTVFNGSRPVILATPQYGVGPMGFLAAVHRMSGRKAVNLFYDTARQEPRLTLLFERAGIDAMTLFSGFPGLLSGIRALARNEYLVMVPDVIDDLAQTLAVPFYGRLLRVAPGTAFFSLRTNAWIVPVFASPRRTVGIDVCIGRPIDPVRFATLDEPQAIFLLTRMLFMSFEREIRRAPEHWHLWAQFPHVSTPVEPPGRLDEDAPLRLLKDMCDASPHLVLDVPELEMLVR
jgi:lauroyl/myristoyl acyltransferase